MQIKKIKNTIAVAERHVLPSERGEREAMDTRLIEQCPFISYLETLPEMCGPDLFPPGCSHCSHHSSVQGSVDLLRPRARRGCKQPQR